MMHSTSSLAASLSRGAHEVVVADLVPKWRELIHLPVHVKERLLRDEQFRFGLSNFRWDDARDSFICSILAGVYAPEGIRTFESEVVLQHSELVEVGFGINLRPLLGDRLWTGFKDLVDLVVAGCRDLEGVPVEAVEAEVVADAKV